MMGNLCGSLPFIVLFSCMTLSLSAVLCRSENAEFVNGGEPIAENGNGPLGDGIHQPEYNDMREKYVERSECSSASGADPKSFKKKLITAAVGLGGLVAGGGVVACAATYKQRKREEAGSQGIVNLGNYVQTAAKHCVPLPKAHQTESPASRLYDNFSKNLEDLQAMNVATMQQACGNKQAIVPSRTPVELDPGSRVTNLSDVTDGLQDNSCVLILSDESDSVNTLLTEFITDKSLDVAYISESLGCLQLGEDIPVFVMPKRFLTPEWISLWKSAKWTPSVIVQDTVTNVYDIGELFDELTDQQPGRLYVGQDGVFEQTVR